MATRVSSEGLYGPQRDLGRSSSMHALGLEFPPRRNARFDLLLAGAVTSKDGKVVSTCSVVRDETRIMVIDPGMADSDQAITEPLATLGILPNAITDVIISHHHPDHTIRVGLFPNATIHDHWATYRGSIWEDTEADGRLITPSVGLIRVPGHTSEDIAIVVGTPEALIVLTHLWWDAEGPPEDPYAEDPVQLHSSRRRVLAVADLIVPGHGMPFRPSNRTPT